MRLQSSSRLDTDGASHPPNSGEGGDHTGIGTGSNRFTLTDYVYDREDESEHPTNATAGPSSSVPGPQEQMFAPTPAHTSALPPGAAPAHAFDDIRPSSWAMAVSSEITNIRGSTIGIGSPFARPIRDGNLQDVVVYPPASTGPRSATDRMPGVPAKQYHSYFARQPHEPSQHTPPISLPPGPQTLPPDNTVVKPLARIPTAPSTAASSLGVPSQPPSTLRATLSSGSIASSHPPPFLPPSQLSGVKNGSRPSLATMPSSGSTARLGHGRKDETELDVMPALGWDEEDRSRNVSFTGVGEKDPDGDGDKGEAGGSSAVSKGERESGSFRLLDWIFPKSLYCRLLLGTLVFELVIDLIIEANILWRFNNEVNSSNPTASMLENKRRLPIFLIIFGLAHLWQLILTIIAIRTKNTIQISAITIFNFAFLAWAVIQVSELRQILGDLQTSLIDDDIQAGGPAAGSRTTNLLNLPLNILAAVIIGVVAVCCLVLSVLAYFVRREFGWQRYRFLGADLQIRGYYRTFQVFECLIYFAAFFAAGFGIQFIWLVLQKTDAEYIITWVMFPLSLIFLVIGRTAAKYENKPFMIFFCTGLTLGQAYFIFKLVRIWQQSSTVYQNVSKSLTVFNVLSLLCLLACLVWSILVFKDFGKGLKGAVLSQYSKSPRVGFNRWRREEEPGAASTAAQKRISID